MGASSIRCFHFDEDGRPKRRPDGQLGCYYSSSVCNFVHPDQPGWTFAKLSAKAPRNLVEDTHNPLGGRSFPPSRNLAKARTSTSTGSRLLPVDSRSRIDPPSHRDKMSAWRSGSPTISSASFESYTKPRYGEDSLRRNSSSTVDESGPSNPRREEKMANRGESSSSTPRAANTSAMTSIVSLVKPRLARKDASLPSVPPAASAVERPAESSPNPQKEPTLEERRTTWVDRIKLLSECVTARSEHVKVLAELRRYRQLTESWRYANLAEVDKSRLNDQLAAVRARCDEKKKDLNTLVNQLINSDIWPVIKDPQGGPGLEERFEDVKKEIKELRELASRLHQDLLGVMAKQAEALASASTAPTPMEVEEEGAHRGSKRRRLSSGEDAAGSRHRALKDESEKLRDQMDKLERRLEELENSMIQHDAEVLEEVESRIEAKIEDMKGTHPPIKPEDSEKEHKVALLYGQRLEGIELNLNATGDQVTQIAQEVGDLIFESDALHKENANLRQENERWKVMFAEVEAKQQHAENVLDQNRKQIQALMTAVTNHTPQALAPPRPQMPAPEYLAEALREPILQSVNSLVQRQIQEFHKSFEETIRAHGEEIHSNLWPKLSLTLKMVETIKNSVERTNQADESGRLLTNGSHQGS